MFMKISESKYSNCLYFTANALARKVERIAIDSWKSVNLSPSHAYLLMLVIEEPGLQPGVLSDQLQLKPSTITRLIEKLEKKKLLIRTMDGRITNIYPTPSGKNLLPKLKECLKQFYQNYVEVLGKEESVRLVKSMHQLIDKLEG